MENNHFDGFCMAYTRLKGLTSIFYSNCSPVTVTIENTELFISWEGSIKDKYEPLWGLYQIITITAEKDKAVLSMVKEFRGIYRSCQCHLFLPYFNKLAIVIEETPVQKEEGIILALPGQIL